MNRRVLQVALVLAAVIYPLIAQEEEESRWEVSLGTRYLSRYVSYGIDLSDDQPAFQPNVAIAHHSGLSLGVDGVRVLGTNGRFQQWSLTAGYEHSFTDWLKANAEFSHVEYTADTVSILASLSNSLSFSLDTDLDVLSVGLSYDTFFGTNTAHYFGVNISTAKSWGDLTLVPLVQATWMSQEVPATRAKNKGQSGKALPKAADVPMTISVAGLSSVSVHLITVYSLGKGFVLTLNPFYLHAPKSELLTHSSQFLVTVGLNYAIGW